MKTTVNKIESGSFAEACYDNNSIPELQAALKMRRADRIDMKEWNLSATEWRNQIKNALENKIADKK